MSDIKVDSKAQLIELKQEAMGLGMVQGRDYHPSIGYDALVTKITEFQEAVFKKAEAKRQEDALLKTPLPLNLPVTPSANESKNARRSRLLKEANRLQRVTITCLNKDKQEWFGEILTFSNSFIGTIKKYVPFNNTTPYHVPSCLVQILRERQHTVFKNHKDQYGNITKKGHLVPEFSITEHAPLTKAEHDELRKTQLLAKGQVTD